MTMDISGWSRVENKSIMGTEWVVSEESSMRILKWPRIKTKVTMDKMTLTKEQKSFQYKGVSG